MSEGFHQLDVLAHGFFHGGAFDGVPGIEFGPADEIETAGSFAGCVPLSRLLIKGVKLQEGVVAGALCESVHVELSLREPSLQIRHRDSPFLDANSDSISRIIFQLRPVDQEAGHSNSLRKVAI